MFADVASAYYSVIKELGTGVPGDWGPARISKIFEFTGLSPDHFQEFLRLLATPAHTQAGVSSHLNNLVMRAQEHTWSVMQGCDQLAFNESGTRPGDPLADVCFAFIYEKRIGRACHRMKQEGIFPELPPVAPMSLFPGEGMEEPNTPESVLADDSAFPFVTGPRDITKTIARIGDILVEEMSPAGLKIKFGPKKTAAVVRLSGEGSRGAKEELHFSEGCIAKGNLCEIPVVRTYKHLGCMATGSASMGPEVAARCSLAAGTLPPLRKHVLGSASLDLADRVNLCSVYIESVLFYNVGTWRIMTPRQAEQVHTRYLKGLRTATRTDFLDRANNDRVMDATVLALAERPPAGAVIHAHRLRHWRRVLKFGSRSLRAYLRATSSHKYSWEKALEESINWLREHCHKVGSMVGYDQDPKAWEALVN